MTKWKKSYTAVIVSVMVLLSSGSIVAAVQADEDNPLITLSYLKGVFTTLVLGETDVKIQNSQAGYEAKLDAKINAATGGGDVAGTASSFAVVDVPQGQSLIGEVGCEIMLRVGSATVVSPASPGLIDSTDGTTLESGNNLQQNHLYMVTIEGRGIQAVNAAVKVLVRGAYSIQ